MPYRDLPDIGGGITPILPASGIVNSDLFSLNTGNTMIGFPVISGTPELHNGMTFDAFYQATYNNALVAPRKAFYVVSATILIPGGAATSFFEWFRLSGGGSIETDFLHHVASAPEGETFSATTLIPLDVGDPIYFHLYDSGQPLINCVGTLQGVEIPGSLA